MATPKGGKVNNNDMRIIKALLTAEKIDVKKIHRDEI